MTRLAYIDGNNNVYEIGDRLAYVPVTPEQSSSGTYSGGDPKSVAIDAELRNELIALLDQLIADTQNVIADRPKGCGTIVRGDVRTSIRASSPLKAELEQRLRALLAQ